MISEETTLVSNDQKNLGVLAHLCTFFGFMIPLANIWGPIAIYMLKKEEMPFAAAHAKEVINFQISAVVYFCITGALCYILIGIPMIAAVGIWYLVCPVLAALACKDGKEYRYPFVFRLFS